MLAFALGGEAGSRTAKSLQMTISGDTLLNAIRRSVLPTNKTKINVLGVDDWAKKKGQTYGTILVDFERRCPVDLLPDRERDTLAEWLRQHPGIKTVSRDRSLIYAEAVRCGAPSATCVADRWHLLKNLREAFENFLHRRHSALVAARQNVSIPSRKDADSEQCCAKPDSVQFERRAREQHQQQLFDEQRRAKQQQKEERFRQVNELCKQGYNILQTARALRMHRRTVRLFLKAEEVPTRKPSPPRVRAIHQYQAHLKQRWAEGERNMRRLHEEIQAQGFRGAERTLRQFTQHWRPVLPEDINAHLARIKAARAPSPRQTVWLLSLPDLQKHRWRRDFAGELCQQNEDIDCFGRLAKEFQQLMREKKSGELADWLKRAKQSRIAELATFANGVEKDRAGVEAAFVSEWSQGQVEGQVNRLKMLKRQMYGRAGFDLLRARVLHRA